MSIARGAARGAAWNFASVLAERSFGFVILGLLLRVVPADVVGLVAIASALTDLARITANSGANEQVQANPGDRAVEAGAFWCQLIIALLFTMVIWLAAPVIAAAYGQKLLVPVLEVMALNVVMTSFIVVPAGRLASSFRFRAMGLISLGSTMTGGLAALPLAYTGHAVAALTVQRVAGVGFFVLAAAILARWVPPGPPSFAVLRASFRFSLPLMQAALVDYIALTGYVMLAGLRMPVTALGEFRIAQRLVEVLQEIGFMPARNVLMPVFVRVRHDEDLHFQTARGVLDMLFMAIFLICAVAGAAAKPVVLLMFGARWEAAVPVFAVMTLMAPAVALYSVINPMLTAVGKTRLVWRYAVLNVAVIAVAVWFAAPYGLLALAWALAARGLVALVLFMVALRQGLARPVGPILRLLLVPCVALAAARAASWWVMAALPGMALVPQLLVSAAVAGGVFALLALALAPARVWGMGMRLGRVLTGAA